MRTFKPGQKVVCVNNGDDCGFSVHRVLTVGKEYVIVDSSDVNDGGITIRCDDGKLCSFFKWRFALTMSKIKRNLPEWM